MVPYKEGEPKAKPGMMGLTPKKEEPAQIPKGLGDVRLMNHQDHPESKTPYKNGGKAPAKEAPATEAPAKEAPVEEAPAEAPVEEAPAM